MNRHDRHEPEHPQPGHEVRDVNVRRLVIYGAALVVVIAVSMGIMKVTFDYFARREAGNQPPPSTLASNARDQLPPEPRLQQNPLIDLRELRLEEIRLMTSFGWVDQARGIVRIPVEDAMRLTVRRGLPHRADPVVTTSPAAAAEGRP